MLPLPKLSGQKPKTTQNSWNCVQGLASSATWKECPEKSNGYGANQIASSPRILFTCIIGPEFPSLRPFCILLQYSLLVIVCTTQNRPIHSHRRPHFCVYILEYARWVVCGLFIRICTRTIYSSLLGESPGILWVIRRTKDNRFFVAGPNENPTKYTSHTLPFDPVLHLQFIVNQPVVES